MADIRKDGSEVLHYDEPDIKIMYRRNFIPAGVNLENDMSIHWHDDVEFIYVEVGHTFYKLNDGMVRINAGEGIFVNSGQLHLIVPGDEDCLLHCLIFNPHEIGSNEYMYNQYIKPITCNKRYPYLMLSDKVAWQAEIFRIIENMHDAYYDRQALKVYKSIYSLWELLFNNLEKEEINEEKTNSNLEIVKKMMAFISTNYNKKLTLLDICQSGNVGKTKGIELFSKFINQTPIEYLNNYRIEKSTNLLRETDKSITEIAVEVGFSDNSYYTKYFKERMHCRPKDYRREYQVPVEISKVEENEE